MKIKLMLFRSTKGGFRDVFFFKSLLFLIFLISAVNVFGGGGGVNKMHGYRWRNDDGSETAASWKAAVNTGITISSANTNFRLRIAHSEVTFPGTPTGYSLQYSADQSVWTTITSDRTTNAFALSPTTYFNDGDATSNQLSTLDFTPWYCISSSEPTPAPASTTTGNELEWCLQATTHAIAGTTYYFRTINLTLTITYEVTATLTYSPCINPADGGTIGSAQTICSGSTPAGLTNTTLPGGQSGTLEYQWQSSTTSAATGFTNPVTGTYTSTIYSPGPLAATTWYKRLAKVTCESVWVESNVIKINIDAVAPAVVAKTGGSVTLDATGNYTLLPADVLTSYSDAGVGIQSVTMVPATVNCANLGLKTITVTVKDNCNNQTVVTPQITVVEGTALPSPWASCVLGASNGIGIYTPCTGPGRYTLTSTGYSSPSADVQEFVYQNITGNGTIIANIYSLAGNGWAGVQIRESCSPSAKKVLIKTQLQTFLRSDIRNTAGGATVSTQILRAGVKWLKITRTGNRFDAFTSADGIGWMSAFSTTITMGATVQIGIISEGINFTSTTTAKFEHVSVNGSTPTKASESGITENVRTNSLEGIEIYPNPASYFVTIEIPDINQKVKSSVYSSEGRLLHSEMIEQVTTQIDVSYLKPGVYILRFDSEGEVVTKRLVVY